MAKLTREQERVLVERCTRGDDRAWEELLETYAAAMATAIRATLRQRGHAHDPALEDEVLADSFAELAARDGETLRSFRGESGLATFLSVVASRRAIRAIRGTVRRARAVEKRAAIEKGDPRAGERDPAESAERVEDRASIERALAELPTFDRMLLSLFYLEGKSHAEIATVARVATSGMGTRIARARARLRRQLERLGWKGALAGDDEEADDEGA